MASLALDTPLPREPLEPLTAPFPWMGGKSRVAHLVWDRFGADVPNLVEPFAGSLALLLGRPGGAGRIETVNDADGLLCNAWRGIQQDPGAMAAHAEYLAHECDLHARHSYLVGQREVLTARLEGDPEYCDVKLAGWWLWGIALWIGSGWCAGVGPWQRVETEGGWQLVNTGTPGGCKRQLLHLGNAGQGVNRKLLHLGNAGQGVNRGGLAGGRLRDYMDALSYRLRRVRVCCGDWSRVCGPAPTLKQGPTAVFLDPPYSAEADRDEGCYAVDSGTVAHDVRAWCEEWGQHPLLRIALCGYAGEGHEALEGLGWEAMQWKAHGGYGGGRGGRGDANKRREVIWFSPHCLRPTQGALSLEFCEAPHA